MHPETGWWWRVLMVMLLLVMESAVCGGGRGRYSLVGRGVELPSHLVWRTVPAQSSLQCGMRAIQAGVSTFGSRPDESGLVDSGDWVSCILLHPAHTTLPTLTTAHQPAHSVWTLQTKEETTTSTSPTTATDPTVAATTGASTASTSATTISSPISSATAPIFPMTTATTPTSPTTTATTPTSPTATTSAIITSSAPPATTTATTSPTTSTAPTTTAFTTSSSVPTATSTVTTTQTVPTTTTTPPPTTTTTTPPPTTNTTAPTTTTTTTANAGNGVVYPGDACDENGKFYLHPSDCTKYLWCDHTVVIEMSCGASTLYWQHSLSTCNHDYLVTEPCTSL